MLQRRVNDGCTCLRSWTEAYVAAIFIVILPKVSSLQYTFKLLSYAPRGGKQVHGGHSSWVPPGCYGDTALYCLVYLLYEYDRR